MSKSKIMVKSVALEAATAYCVKAGLPLEKFLSNTCGCSYEDGSFDFLRFPYHTENAVIGEGAKGEPILHVNADLSVEETEFTRKYLSKD